MTQLKELIQALLPRQLYRLLLLSYHLLFTFLSALFAGFPANKLTVIGVTGTKGKSSVAEMIASILETAGYRVALASTIRFTVDKVSEPNLFKMTLPGRGFIQRFLARAVRARCEFAVIEITSEAALQYRHLFLSLNALVFTNLAKEHLESHGGMDQYFAAKYRIGEALARSPKRPRVIVANADDEYGLRFLKLPVEERIPVSLKDAQDLRLDGGVEFTLGGTSFAVPHPGTFSAMNALAAIKATQAFGVPYSVAAKALKNLTLIPGRAERIDAGQNFLAVVDYAHTPDSLRALYEAFPRVRKICVLGNTGGGRDTWKRPEMGRIAEQYCSDVILTNEDPYDEDPWQIVREMAAGMTKQPAIIMDRREAIRTALTRASEGDAVLITGKGTDPYIMGPRGGKLPWSDAAVVREELAKLVS